MNIPRGIIQIITLFHPKYALYAIGDNSSDQLGLPTLTNTDETDGIHSTFYDDDDDDPIPKWRYLPAMSSLIFHSDFVHSGDGNFFIKSMDDRIYTAGFNSYGSCGVGSTNGKIENFTPITFPDDDSRSGTPRRMKIDVISNGVYTDHTFIVLVNDEENEDEIGTQTQIIYGFGSNLSQQQGFRIPKSQGTKHVISPQQIDCLNVRFRAYGHRIIQISTGLEHSLFLTANGRVFSCGDNFHGQCGVISQYREHLDGDLSDDSDTNQDSKNYVERLQLIPFLYDIEKIACGAFHNLCIDKTQNLWTFGFNESSELGLGPNHVVSKECTAVRNPYFDDANVVDMKCGDMHSMVFTEEGMVYLFGANASGQIGNGEHSNNVSVPYRIQDGEGMEKLRFTTGDCGCNHSVLVSNVPSNELYAFGGNNYGQIGRTDDMNLKQTVPYKVDRKDIGMTEEMRIVKVIADDELTLVLCAI